MSYYDTVIKPAMILNPEWLKISAKISKTEANLQSLKSKLIGVEGVIIRHMMLNSQKPLPEPRHCPSTSILSRTWPRSDDTNE